MSCSNDELGGMGVIDSCDKATFADKQAPHAIAPRTLRLLDIGAAFASFFLLGEVIRWRDIFYSAAFAANVSITAMLGSNSGDRLCRSCK